MISSRWRQRRISTGLEALFAALATALVIVAISRVNFPSVVREAIAWSRALGWLVPMVFIAAYNIATLLCVPGALLTVKGGFLFRIVWGTVYVSIGAIFGAILAFLCGRYFSRDWVSRQVARQPGFQFIDEAVARSG